MSSTLKMIFSLAGSTKTTTLSLAEPADSLSLTAVNSAAAEIVGNNVIKVDGNYAGALEEAYVETVTRTELA